MIVAGGTYREICEFPYDKTLYGPGLRSAAAVGEISSKETLLHTYSSESIERELRRKAGGYRFSVDDTKISGEVSFHYIHNHSHPGQHINGDVHNPNLGPIDGNAILRFGFVEGDAVVKGERVVYDPQSPEEKNFYDNGSKAGKLALVLNQHEARAYTGKEDHLEMLDSLVSGGNSADVAVVKCGSAGAIIHTGEEIVEIPLYETSSIWNIGSGDIFSSIFAIYWAEKELPPAEAAKNASLGTAYFCATRNLPIPKSPEDVDGFEPVERDPAITDNSPTIYLATPFFTVGEFWFMEEVRDILFKEGVDVVAPYYDIGRAEDYDEHTQVAQADLQALEDSDAVLALCDHCDPGTYFELGHARESDVPVTAYMTEYTENDSLMLDGTGCEIYSDLATAIFKAIWSV